VDDTVNPVELPAPVTVIAAPADPANAARADANRIDVLVFIFFSFVVSRLLWGCDFQRWVESWQVAPTTSFFPAEGFCESLVVW
jgi:hypothetical protein